MCSATAITTKGRNRRAAKCGLEQLAISTMRRVRHFFAIRRDGDRKSMGRVKLIVAGSHYLRAMAISRGHTIYPNAKA